MQAATSWKISKTAHGFAVLTVAGVAAVTVAGLALWGAVAPAGAQTNGVFETEIGCNDRGIRCREVFAAFSFEGGIEGDLLLSFEDATLLTEDSFVITAELVDPRDPQLTSRLPRDTFIPDDFPVLVKIEPQAGAQLSFRRNWTLELVSENLEFSSHTPFRLFRAPTGGQFEDISFSLGSGSFRVRGAGGSLSEFLMAADLRPVEQVVGRKLGQLQTLVNENADSIGSVVNDLNLLIQQTVGSLEQGNLQRAVSVMTTLIQLIETNAGTQISDDTRPGDGQIGLAARLLSSALTLRHTIFLGLESAQGGMSGFSKSLQADGFSMDLVLDFDEAFVVDPEDLDIIAEVVDLDDLSFRGRFPDGVHVPEEFPVLVRINPKSGEEQAFSGRYEVEIRTDTLSFLAGSPLRLFKAPDGGAFEDITRTFGLGSFRVRGAGGSLSEFVIAEDRRSIENIIAGKFQSVAGVFEDNAADIPVALRGQLEGVLTQVQADVEQGDFDAAISGIESVVETIKENSGDAIPALWRSDEALVNVAGELISLLETLIFSLELKETPLFAAQGDVNLDGRVDVGDIFFLIDQVFGDSPPPELLFAPNADEQR